MNRKKLHEKNLARIVEWMTAPDVCVADLPRKVRKEIGKRYVKEYLGNKWKKLEQEAYEKGLFTVEDRDELLYFPTLKGQHLIWKHYPIYKQYLHG